MKQINLFKCAMIAILMLAGNASASDQIDTSNILLIGYYDNILQIDLSQAIQEFDHVTETTGQYVEGIITIWHDSSDGINTGGIREYENIDGTETDILLATNVTVRVKSDGWVVGWLTNDQNANDFVFWRDVNSLYIPSDTTIGQAIHRITTRIGRSYDKSQVNYYSYKYPAADRLLIKGRVCSVSSETYYLLIPSTVTVYITDLTSSIYGYSNYIKVDGEYVYLSTQYQFARFNEDITDVSRDIRHSITTYSKLNLKSAVVILYQSC